MKVWLSQDAAARALGADGVAKAMTEAGVTPVRTGSRAAMIWRIRASMVPRSSGVKGSSRSKS